MASLATLLLKSTIYLKIFVGYENSYLSRLDSDTALSYRFIDAFLKRSIRIVNNRTWLPILNGLVCETLTVWQV